MSAKNCHRPKREKSNPSRRLPCRQISEITSKKKETFNCLMPLCSTWPWLRILEASKVAHGFEYHRPKIYSGREQTFLLAVSHWRADHRDAAEIWWLWFSALQKFGKKKQQFEKFLRERKQPPRVFSHTLNIESLIYWSESIQGCLLTLLKFRFVAACTRRGSLRHSRCPLSAYWWWSSPPWGGCWGQWFLPGGLSFPLHGGETVI